MMSSMDINAAQSARFGGGPPQGMMVAPGSAPVLPQTDQVSNLHLICFLNLVNGGFKVC